MCGPAFGSDRVYVWPWSLLGSGALTPEVLGPPLGHNSNDFTLLLLDDPVMSGFITGSAALFINGSPARYPGYRGYWPGPSNTAS